MIAGSDLASSRSFLALSGFMLNSLATCSTLFSSIIWHLHFWPQHRYVQIAKISSAYLPYRTVKYAVVNVIVFTVNSNRVHRLSGFPVRCLSLLGLCHLFHLYPCLRHLMPRRSRQRLRLTCLNCYLCRIPLCFANQCISWTTDMRPYFWVFTIPAIRSSIHILKLSIFI